MTSSFFEQKKGVDINVKNNEKRPRAEKVGIPCGSGEHRFWQTTPAQTLRASMNPRQRDTIQVGGDSGCILLPH